jgi:phage tail sheath protein FI
MAKPLYPTVAFSETDLTAVVRSQSSSIGAMCGRFQKGPVGKPIMVSDKNDLLKYFGTPVKDGNGTAFDNLQDWYNAYNYLGYTSGLYVCRVESTDSTNACKNFNATASDFDSAPYVPDGTDMENYYSTMTGTALAGINFVAKNPGTWGNNISVKFATESDLRFGLGTSGDTYYYDNQVTLTLGTAISTLVAMGTSATYVTSDSGASGLVTAVASSGLSLTIAYNDTAFLATDSINVGQTYSASGAQTITGTTAVTVNGYYTFMQNFDEKLQENEIAITVLYNDAVVENHIVSTTVTAKNNYNQAMYIDYWLEQNSQYISAYYNTETTVNLASQANTAVDLTGGTLAAQSAITSALVNAAMDAQYLPKDKYGINLLFDGSFTNSTVQNNIVSICESRKDCFGILSVGVTMPVTTEAAAIDTASTGLIARREAITTSTYAAFYGNFKYQYDMYSGRTFKCSVSGDIAGIYSRNDLLSNPWWAPAGYNRGSLNNVVKLGMVFSKTNQGTLHSKQINIINFNKREGGYYIMSQKTCTGRPSAFGDINVRRLFTYCENAIVNTGKVFQWEFNDEITRSNFSAIVNNFLNTVKSRRGCYDFKVVCDETNNTADIIDDNQLIMDVYMKPSKAIAWITARFTATRTDADFDELVS